MHQLGEILGARLDFKAKDKTLGPLRTEIRHLQSQKVEASADLTPAQKPGSDGATLEQNSPRSKDLF